MRHVGLPAVRMPRRPPQEARVHITQADRRHYHQYRIDGDPELSRHAARRFVWSWPGFVETPTLSIVTPGTARRSDANLEGPGR